MRKTYDGAFTDVTAAFNDNGTNVQMFVSDNDIVYVGKATTFTTIDFCLSVVASGSGIAPTFEYSTVGATWTTLSAADGTNGMRNSGSITYTAPGDWTSELLDSDTLYWVRITRTRNSLSTPPTEMLVKYSSSSTYSWDENGDVTINDLVISSVDIGSSTVISSVLDEDAMGSDSATALATQQSIKAYVDAQVSGENVWDRTVNDISPAAASGSAYN